MSTSFNIEPAVLEQANLLAELKPSEWQIMLQWSVQVLEGVEITESVKAQAEQIGVAASKLAKICTALATILWECSRVIKKESTSLPAVLVQLGLREEIISEFMRNRSRINALKAPLSLSMPAYRGLSWRLDVELGKRSLLSTMEPTFQLRLDLDSNDSKNQTVFLQTDYANLKMLQQELQRAVDELSGVHSQRIARYIS
eukprot:scaffold474_cov169-Ochromonas_danica.AAC.10